MEHLKSSFDIQVNACKVIWKLSILLDSPAVISDAGEIRSVVNTMKNCPDDIKIQERCISILSSLGLSEIVLKSGWM